MTAPEWIALALGLVAALMVVASQHGIGTRNTTAQNHRPKEHTNA